MVSKPHKVFGEIITIKNLFHTEEVIEIITREVDIEMNPQELAEEFWNMDSKQQADFFNILAGIIEENQGRGVMQLDYISFESSLYPNGSRLINMLADRVKEYSGK